MKHLLLTTIAGVLVMGCATTQQSTPPAEANTGVTPLHRAASKVHKEIAELLIAKGADVNAKDKNGRTPLDWAVNWNQAETADILRKHGGKTKKELAAENK